MALDEMFEDREGHDIASLSRADLNLLVHLQVLLEERSVTRAASRVGLSQSAMSHSLARSRRLFGDELVIRVGPSLELTPRGRQLLEPLSRVLRDLSVHVFDRPRFDHTSSTRSFQISCTPTTAVVVVSALLPRLEQQAPGVRVQTVEPRPPYDLAKDPETDVILLADNLRTTLARERLYIDRWVVVSSPRNEHVLDGVSLSDLAMLPHVVFESAGQRTPPYRQMEALGVDLRIVAITDNFLALPLMVADTGAIAVMQLRVAQRLHAAGLVAIRPLPIDVPDLGIDMVWNPRLAGDPACGWLREQLRAAVPTGRPELPSI